MGVEAMNLLHKRFGVSADPQKLEVHPLFSTEIHPDVTSGGQRLTPLLSYAAKLHLKSLPVCKPRLDPDPLVLVPAAQNGRQGRVHRRFRVPDEHHRFGHRLSVCPGAGHAHGCHGQHGGGGAERRPHQRRGTSGNRAQGTDWCIDYSIDRSNNRLIKRDKTDWLFDWLIERLRNWLIQGLTDWLTDWMIIRLIDWLIDL